MTGSMRTFVTDRLTAGAGYIGPEERVQKTQPSQNIVMSGGWAHQTTQYCNGHGERLTLPYPVYNQSFFTKMYEMQHTEEKHGGSR